MEPKKIILVRHGKPSFYNMAPVYGRDFGQLVYEYEVAGIDADSKPPESLTSIISTIGSAFSSGLKRSIRSAEILGLNGRLNINPVFKEADVPYGFLNGLKLRPSTWTIISRLLWFSGYSKNSETFRQAIQRSKKGAHILNQSALEKGSVMLAGHVFMNFLINIELLKLGWKSKLKFKYSYWDWNTLHRT